MSPSRPGVARLRASRRPDHRLRGRVPRSVVEVLPHRQHSFVAVLFSLSETESVQIYTFGFQSVKETALPYLTNVKCASIRLPKLTPYRDIEARLALRSICPLPSLLVGRLHATP